MANIELTEDDLVTLQRCINEGLEPPWDLAKKLFPSLYASYDFKTLKDSKIPTIEYQGKRSEATILNEATLFGGGSPLQLVRSFDGGKLNRHATQLNLFSPEENASEHDWQADRIKAIVAHARKRARSEMKRRILEGRPAPKGGRMSHS